MAGQIDRKQLRKTIRDQGWTIEEAKAGFRAVPPNPQADAVEWHNTPSDWRSDRNTMALMKQQGFIWPYDRKRARAEARKRRKGQG